MKIAQFDLPPDPNVPNESAMRYELRRSHVVTDDYDFVGNGATDGTTVTNIEVLKSKADYQLMWEMMYATVLAVGGIGSLSPTEQAIAGRWLALDASIVQRLRHARRLRLDTASALLYNELERSQVHEIMSDIVVDDLMSKYIEANIQGKTITTDTVEGVLNYIDGTTLTSYQALGLSPGLRHKGWTPATLTLNQLCDQIIDILRIGVY